MYVCCADKKSIGNFRYVSLPRKNVIYMRNKENCKYPGTNQLMDDSS